MYNIVLYTLLYIIKYYKMILYICILHDITLYIIITLIHYTILYRSIIDRHEPSYDLFIWLGTYWNPELSGVNAYLQTSSRNACSFE